MTVGETPVSQLTDKEAAMVPLESSLFDAVPNANFFLGKVAIPGEVLDPEADVAHGRFRAGVYIDRLLWLPESHRQDDGTERDEDDDRSIRFTTMVNSAPGLTHVAGVSRLILKGNVEDPLPVERIFPEAFSDPVSAKSVEASRFIAMYPKPNVQRQIALANIRAMVMNAVELDAPHIYAVVEEPLVKYFGALKLPLEMLTDSPEVVPGYGNTKNYAIRFSPEAIISAAEHPSMQGKPLAKLFNEDARSDGGAGFYNETLTKHVFMQEAA